MELTALLYQSGPLRGSIGDDTKRSAARGTMGERQHMELRGSMYNCAATQTKTTKRSSARGTMGARPHVELCGSMYNCAATQAETTKRSAARGTMGARQHMELRGSMYNCAATYKDARRHLNAAAPNRAAVYECADERRVRGNTGVRQHTGARHHAETKRPFGRARLHGAWQHVNDTGTKCAAPYAEKTRENKGAR